MARLESLELPQDIGMPKEQVQAFNTRFLLIAERLRSVASTAASGGMLQGTHAQRTATAAEGLGAGTQYWENDRGVVYLVRQVSNAKVWAYEAGMLVDAKSARPSDLSTYDKGYLFYATDDTTLYRWSGTGWTWLSGTLRKTQSQLAALAATLGAGDAGILVWVSDYAHMLQWTGAAWTRGPGDSEHSDTFWAFGAAPTDSGWHACDGSTVNFLKYDGSIGSRVLPNADGSACYMKLASTYSDTITAAHVPTFTGASDTTSSAGGTTPTGTVSAFFTGASLPNHKHVSPLNWDGATPHILNIAGVGGDYGAVAKFTGVADGSTHLTGQMTATEDIGLTPTGTVTASFTGDPIAAHSHTVTPTGTISIAGGDPIASFQAISYYRQ